MCWPVLTDSNCTGEKAFWSRWDSWLSRQLEAKMYDVWSQKGETLWCSEPQLLCVRVCECWLFGLNKHQAFIGQLHRSPLICQHRDAGVCIVGPGGHGGESVCVRVCVWVWSDQISVMCIINDLIPLLLLSLSQRERRRWSQRGEREQQRGTKRIGEEGFFLKADSD